MPVVRLSTTYVANNLQCPDGKNRSEHCDSELPGLYIEVRSTSQGQGTYYLRYKDANGRTCHQKLGRTTEIDLMDGAKQPTLAS